MRMFICYYHNVPLSCFFFFNDTATTEIYTLSLHDALPISATPEEQRAAVEKLRALAPQLLGLHDTGPRSEEHTSELQSHSDLVCRHLLEKKKNKRKALYKKMLLVRGTRDTSVSS